MNFTFVATFYRSDTPAGGDFFLVLCVL